MIELTATALRQLFPRAPQEVLDAFLAKQDVLSEAGINHTRQRLAYFFANIEHECGGFTIPNLTENINYSAERMAQVWPNRFSSAAAVRAKYGTEPGWQKKAFDDIYGNRMGNRPGTSDGSTFIGRGGPQWTGRDGYKACGRIAGIPAVEMPESVCNFELQPEVCAAFWTWKNLNVPADLGDFNRVVRLWNGGTNGMADRLAKLSGNDPILKRLEASGKAKETAKTLPGDPPTPEPPKEALDAATKRERQARTGGAATAGAGGAAEAANQTAGTTQPDKPPLIPQIVTWTCIGLGIVILVVAAYYIAKKHGLVKENWK